MRPYLVETILVNSKGVRMRFCNTYPCMFMASKAFENSKCLIDVIESRLYEQCLKFDRLLDEYTQSK